MPRVLDVLVGILLACASHPVHDVVTSSDARSAVGQRVRVTGIAERAKLAAMVITDRGFSVYCLDRDDWPADVVKKRVTVEGVLEKTDQFKVRIDEKGAISQGTQGGDWVIRRSTYRVVE